MERLLNIKYDWRHCKVIRDSPETLFHLATRKVSLTFWYGESGDIMLLKERLKVEKKVREKIISMVLPEPCKESLLQMVELFKYHLQRLLLVLPYEFKTMSNLLKPKICWTSQGTIDEISTAKALADATEIDVKIRFGIAVIFCLEDRVNALSVEMPQDYLDNNVSFRYLIEAMEDASDARKHFNIYEFVPDYMRCFEKMQLYFNIELGK